MQVKNSASSVLYASYFMFACSLIVTIVGMLDDGPKNASHIALTFNFIGPAIALSVVYPVLKSQNQQIELLKQNQKNSSE
jgi:hypothetical protein